MLTHAARAGTSGGRARRARSEGLWLEQYKGERREEPSRGAAQPGKLRAARGSGITARDNSEDDQERGDAHETMSPLHIGCWHGHHSLNRHWHLSVAPFVFCIAAPIADGAK